LARFPTARSKLAPFRSYMAALFASAEGNVATTSIEAAQNQSMEKRPGLILEMTCD